MRLLTVEETAKKIGFVAFGPGTELGTPAIQQAAEEESGLFYGTSVFAMNGRTSWEDQNRE